MAKKTRKSPTPKFVQYIKYLLSIPDVQKLMVAMTGLAEAKITLATVQTQLSTKQLELSAALLPIRADIETNNTTCDLVLSQRRLVRVRKGEEVPPTMKTEKRFMKKEFMPSEAAKRDIFKAKRHFQAKMAKYAKAKKTFGGAKKVTVSPNGEIRLGKEKLGQVQARTI